MLAEERINKDFCLQLKSFDEEYVFITAIVTNEEGYPLDICKNIYEEIKKFLLKYKITILQERIFGSLCIYEKVCSIRKEVLDSYPIEKYQEVTNSITYLEGNPYWGQGLSGISIYGMAKSHNKNIYNVIYEDKIFGRKWEDNDAEYMILQNIHGLKLEQENAYQQALNMFEKANIILLNNGFTYSNIIRTWIYLHNILSQYSEFNAARNQKFKEFSLLPDELSDEEFEQVYLPASTGIGCNNVYKAAGVMNIFAIKKKVNSALSIYNETGSNQKSAYRYGSAFSRSMVLDNKISKQIYLSGTASIDEFGKTAKHNDIMGQIEKTTSVVEALIRNENMSFDNLYEGTVFLKRKEYIKAYQEFCRLHSLKQLPCIITIADICRNDLLFEMDATFGGWSYS